MAPPKDIARSYPKRGLTADVGFRSEPKFCGDGSTEFDGSADELSTTATLSVATVPIQTFCVWVKPTTVNANRGIVVNGLSNSNDAFYLYQYLTGYGQASNTSSPGQSRNFALNSVKQDQWQFVCGVYDATDPASVSFSLYVDGVSYSDTAPLGTGAVSGFFKVGRSSSGYFAGKIANVKVFDVALTQDQVRELYNNPGLTTPTGVNSSNLRRHYELETDFNDSGADSENLTSAGSPSFTVDRPQLPRGLDLTQNAAMARVYTGRALDQDGSVDRLQGTNFTDATATACTVSFWMYQRDGGPGRIVHNFGGGATAVDRFIAFMSSGYFLTAGEITSGNRLGFSIANLPLNQWHHVAFVLDGNGTTSLNTTILYLNGEKYDSPGAVGVIWDTTTFDIGGTVHGYANQLIAGVKVFNTKLTDAQARELYHNPEQVLPTGVSASSLRRYYPLSDYNDTGGTGGRYFQDMGADGEPLEDIGSSSMAFAQPVPCPQLGLQQSATRLYHPGGAQGATATITAPGTTASLSVWVLWDQARTSYPISIGDVVSSSGDGLSIRINGAGQITMYQRDGGGVNQELLSGLTITEGEWNHIVVATRSDSPYWRCWLNNSEASSPNALVNTVNVTSTNCNLGMNNYNFGMGGIANDAAVWNTELGDSDVAALYNSGVQGMDVSTVQSANLLGWWKFDDLTTLKDYSGNGANATVTGTFNAASFPENASGSTIVGDFSLKRKGVSVLNPTGTPAVTSNLIRAEIANDGSLNPNPTNGGYTASVFIRLEQQDIGGGTWVPMILGNSNVVSSLNYLLFYFPGTNASVPIRLNIGDGTVTNRSYNYPSALPNPEEWHQVAFTIDFSTSPTTFRLYQDGALVSTQATNNHSASDLGDLSVGAYWSGNGNFPGAIACVKIYQTKLSDNEIEQIYRSDLRLIKGLENE